DIEDRARESRSGEGALAHQGQQVLPLGRDEVEQPQQLHQPDEDAPGDEDGERLGKELTLQIECESIHDSVSAPASLPPSSPIAARAKDRLCVDLAAGKAHDAALPSVPITSRR